VSAGHALDVEVRLYDRLFRSENPGATGDHRQELNPESLQILPAGKVEPSVAGAAPGTRYQFERLGYFAVDPDSHHGRLVFNRTVTLKDTWAKIEQRG
jgi:glutaminyl-tRNA synthetase